MPRVDGGSSQWRVDGQEFPALGTQKTASKVIGSADPGDTGRGRQRGGHPIPIPRVVDRGMRPARNIRSVRKGNRAVRTRGVRGSLTSPLSPLAKSFTPRPTSDKHQNQRQYKDIDLHRSPATTGVGGTESSWDNIKNKNATIGMAKPIEIEKPVAMADVAEPRGPARTGAGGPVVTEICMTPATDRTGASGPRRSKTDAPVTPEFCFQSGNNRTTVSGPAATVAGGPVEDEKGRSLTDGIAEAGMITGTGTGGPVIAGTRFTTVAEVYAPITETEINQRSEVRELNPIANDTAETTSSDQLEYHRVKGDSVVSGDTTGNSGDKNDAHFRDPDGIRQISDTEQVLIPSGCSSDSVMEAVKTGITADPEEGDAIMVGVVGSAAP